MMYMVLDFQNYKEGGVVRVQANAEKIENAKMRKLITYRWVIWGILMLAYVIVFFHRLAIGVVRDELIGEFGISDIVFANIGTTYFYVYLFMQIPSGILVDLLGPRKTVTTGTFISGIGSIIFGLSQNVFWIFFGRILVGLGVSVIFIAILKIQSQWFRESEFGTMSGLTIFIGNMGGALAQTPLAMLVAILTWRMSFIGIGVITLVIAILCYLFVRNNPVEMGFPPINKNEIEEKEKNIENSEKANIIKALLTVIKNVRTWPVFFAYAGVCGAMMPMMGIWGISYMVDVYSITKTAASNYILCTVLGSALGSVVIGKVSDKIQKRKLPMIIFSVIYIFSWAIIVFTNGGKPPIQMMMPLLFVLGFSSVAFVLSWACCKEVNPPEIVGISTSVANIGGFLGAAVLPSIIGRVFDKYGGILPIVELYQKGFLCSFISAFIGFVCMLFIKETNCRNIYND